MVTKNSISTTTRGAHPRAHFSLRLYLMACRALPGGLDSLGPATNELPWPAATPATGLLTQQRKLSMDGHCLARQGS